MADWQLHRRLNTTYSSTRDLPKEILSYIFELVCAPTEADDPPNDCPRITLASVSSHWHEVVWTTPQLWRTYSARHPLQRMVSSLQMFADNHRAPSSIYLTFHFLGEGGIETLLQAFETVLLQDTASHIRQIVLTNLPPEYMTIIKVINEHCFNIKKLYISKCRLSYDLSSWSYFLTTQFPSCWSTLTNLGLKGFPLDICFDSLFGCPQLIRLAWEVPTRPINGLTRPQHRQAQVTSFPHLEYLSLSFDSPSDWIPWFDSFVQFYQFPGLRELHWLISFHFDHQSPELLNRFLSTLPRCCDTLRLSIHIYYPYVTLKKWMKSALLHIGEIKNLIVSDDNPTSFLLMMQLFRDPAFFPSLTHFKYCCSMKDCVENEVIINSIYEALKGRKETSVKSFSLQVPLWEFPYWAAQRVELSRLTDDGSFKLEIIRGCEKLDL